jgi:hypothetical protein
MIMLIVGIVAGAVSALVGVYVYVVRIFKKEWRG